MHGHNGYYDSMWLHGSGPIKGTPWLYTSPVSWQPIIKLNINFLKKNHRFNIFDSIVDISKKLNCNHACKKANTKRVL